MILFLGSGTSLASGLPSVSKIRDELLTGGNDDRINKLLKVLYKLDSNYLNESAPFKNNLGDYGYTGQIFRQETTYEDLFYLIDQIVINGEGLKADVTIESFTDLLRQKSRVFLRGKSKIDQAIELHKLSKLAREYIELKVSNLLCTDKVRGLDLIIELIESTLIPQLNIVTLNHDLLIEKILTDNNISYNDGFGNEDGDIRWYEDNYSNDSKIYLIKPHGSISWWAQGSENVLQPVNISDTNSTKWRDKKHKPIKDIRTVPSFLTGVGKVYSYNRGIFADQNYRLLRLLHSNNLMIMSGYGWGDIPINFQLQNWLTRDSKNTLILLHQNPNDLASKSLELTHIYAKYIKNKQIIPIKKWLSEISLSEIEMFLQK